MNHSPDQEQVPEPEPLTARERELKVSLIRKRLREFVEPFESTTPWWSWNPGMDRWEDVPAGYHVVDFPPLLTQVDMSVEGVAHASSTRGMPESKPTASLDAIKVQHMLVSQSWALVRALRTATPGDTAVNMRILEMRTPTFEDADLLSLEHKVRRWWIASRIVAGFEEPPQAPHVKCPLCEAQDSLRVRMDVTSRSGLAWCGECHSSWDESTIGLLLGDIDAQETARAVGGIEADTLHREWKFTRRSAAKAVDVEGHVHFCSGCVAWHPGRPPSSGVSNA